MTTDWSICCWPTLVTHKRTISYFQSRIIGKCCKKGKQRSRRRPPFTCSLWRNLSVTITSPYVMSLRPDWLSSAGLGWKESKRWHSYHVHITMHESCLLLMLHECYLKVELLGNGTALLDFGNTNSFQCCTKRLQTSAESATASRLKRDMPAAQTGARRQRGARGFSTPFGTTFCCLIAGVPLIYEAPLTMQRPKRTAFAPNVCFHA